MGARYRIYKVAELNTKTLELLNDLKKHFILQTYQLDGFIIIGRYDRAIASMHREIKNHQLCQR